MFGLMDMNDPGTGRAEARRAMDLRGSKELGIQVPPVAVVVGTSVAPVLAPFVYGKLATELDASVHTLSGAGFNHTLRSAAKLESELDRLVHQTGGRLTQRARILVGHSQGGLAALLAAQRRPDLVAGVITLGTPINGTVRASRWLPISSLRCMSVDSRLLDTIPSADGFACRVVNVVGARDAVVLPQWSGFLDGAEHFTVDAGHLGLIFDPQVIGFIAHIVADGPWPDRSIDTARPSFIADAA